MISNNRKNFTQFVAIISTPFLSIPPNILSLLAVFFAFLFFVSIVYHNYFLAFICFGGFFFDAIDGYVARLTHHQSAFGAFLDSTLDRISDFLVIASFGFAHIASFEIVIVTLTSSFMVSYARARAELAGEGKFFLSEGLIQRSERIFILALLLALYVLFPNFKILSLNAVGIGFMLMSILNIYVFCERVYFSYKKLK